MRSSTFRRFIADPDMAIDVGTANTRLYVHGRGLVADEPTRVEEPPSTTARSGDGVHRFTTPVTHGVVQDIDATARLLGQLLRRVRRFGLVRSRALVCAPSDVSPHEHSALVQAVRRCGVVYVKVVPEPLASAIGAGLDISLPYAQMLVDIGEGITDVAVIRSRRLILTSAVRKGCGDLRAALQRTAAEQHGVFLHPQQAERLLQENGVIAGAIPRQPLTAFGVDKLRCKAKIELSGGEFADAIKPVIGEIVKAIMQTAERVPPERFVEIVESGICLSGGGARLRGLDDLIKSETSIDVNVAADPLHATINELSQMLMTSPETCLWESRMQ